MPEISSSVVQETRLLYYSWNFSLKLFQTKKTKLNQGLQNLLTIVYSSKNICFYWFIILFCFVLLQQSFLFFNFFPFIFISWRPITLQYCSGFCHTLTWISHGFTCVPHPDPPSRLPPIPSLWVFPVHQSWALVLCIQPGLVVCFTPDSILVSMLFSQNIPPSPSPTGSKILFYTSVSLFLFCI